MSLNLELAPAVLDDFERIVQHLKTYAVDNPIQRINEIIEAFEVLKTNPNIGRPLTNNKRELVIGKKSRGYLALYTYVKESKTVFILAIRSQSEASYSSQDLKNN